MGPVSGLIHANELCEQCNMSYSIYVCHVIGGCLNLYVVARVIMHKKS